MLLTEDEAKGKSCPFGPLTVLAAGACGEEPRDYPVWFKCQAPDCMMWRWENDLYSLDKERFLKPGERIDKGEVQLRSTGRGYCGLAGRVTE